MVSGAFGIEMPSILERAQRPLSQNRERDSRVGIVPLEARCLLLDVRRDAVILYDAGNRISDEDKAGTVSPGQLREALQILVQCVFMYQPEILGFREGVVERTNVRCGTLDEWVMKVDRQG